MKKICALLLAVFMLFSVTAFAEETVNTDMGVAYEVPESWFPLNEEMLNGIVSLVQDQIVSDSLQGILASIDPTTMAYFFTDLTLGSTVNIVRQSSSGMSFDTLFSFRSLLAETTKAQYDQAYGVSDSEVVADDEIYSFGNNQYLVLHSKFMGTTVEQYCTIIEDMMFIITFSACDEAQLKDGELLLSSLRML